MLGPTSLANSPKLRRIFCFVSTVCLPCTSCNMSFRVEMTPSMCSLKNASMSSLDPEGSDPGDPNSRKSLRSPSCACFP